MAGSKTQTSTATSEPWKDAQPALRTAVGDATKLYQSGVGFQPYTGSTVVPYAQQSIQGMNAMQNAAQGAQGAFNQNFQNVGNAVGQGGLNDLQRQSVERLQPFARGDLLNGNPHLESMIQRGANDIGSQANLLAGAAGRYGSGAHTSVLAREIGDMANTMRYNDFNTQQGRQMDAIGSIFNAGQQQFGNQMQGTNAMMNAYMGMMAPGETMQGIGANYEDLATRTMNDQLRIFNETQNAPWAALERLNAVASGAGTLGNTQQTTAQGPSRLTSALGGALGGATLFPGPLGAIGGGLLGAFG
jgi:hypothetical protein